MKNIFTGIFIFITLQVFSQGEANFWFFGQNAGLDFNSGNVVPISGSLNTNEGCSSFSDASGNLLFYSDGKTVWDKNHIPMPNGNGNLLGNSSSTQSAIIVPNPGNQNEYYIFTVGANYQDDTPGFNAYIVDITLNGGLGDVKSGPINLSGGLDNLWTEKVTSVKGSECNTFWVISLVGFQYYAYKVDLNGLHTTPVVSTVNYSTGERRGYLKVSPNGKKLASATFNGNNQNEAREGKLHLYSFNDTTGQVSNDGIELISNTVIDGEPYGVEFSPESTKLYVSTLVNQNYKLFQFDLSSANIIGSKTLIHSEFGYRGGLQLAPDGKIYVTIPPDYFTGTPFLDVINSPEEIGLACDFQLDAINLGSGRAMQGLPPFIASILLSVEINDNITSQNINKTTVKRCIGASYELTPQNIPGNPTYKWIFNGNIISNSATLNIPSLSKANEGVYNLEIETVDDCGFKISYKGEVTLEVYNPPTIAKPSNIPVCDDNNDGFYAFDLPLLRNSEVLNGQSDTEFEVLYFDTETNALENSNPITTYTNKSEFSTDVIYARIHNIQNPLCFEIESFTVQVFESPNPPNTISNLTTCDSSIVGTDLDGIEFFDLTEKETEILNGQNPATFLIAYFSDAAKTTVIPNPKNYKNTSRVQPIYIQITNKFNTNCTTPATFNLEVFELPVINSVFELKQCDEDGLQDGYTDFNLDEAKDYITLNNSNLTVTYFKNSTDANNNTNAINAYPYNSGVQSTVYARIENQNGCFRTAQLNLTVSATSFPQNYLKTVISCDLDDKIDGLTSFNLGANSEEIKNLFPTGQNLSVQYYRTLEDAQLEINKIPDNQPYLSENPYSQLMYVRVESDDNGECFGLGPYLNLIVQERPDFDLDEKAIYCTNLAPITVEIFNAKGNYSYTWTDQNGTIISNQESAVISAAGTYSVIATSAQGCLSFEKSIEIEASSIATISQSDLTVIDDSGNNSITINTANLGLGDYEFALNDSFGDYQNEPYFENLLPGIHTLFIRDKNSCGIAQIPVSILGFPKFFTPNNDGHNDKWVVLGVSSLFYKTAIIYIFDRFGKFITQIELDGEGWDGSFNGKLLPGSDYWYSVELEDINGVIRQKKGHFSLIRR
jgi:gliding motility-associated-like protein